MSLEAADRAHPNLIPENNLRLPDAVTIVHGPRRLLASFLLEGDKAARRMGLKLRLRYDFDELLVLNGREAARGNWYPIVDMFNPERVRLSPDNAFWVSGENAAGEIVVTWAGRIHDWRGTNLAEQACAMFYGEDRGQACVVTAEAAHLISGTVVCAGAAWVRPDYRGRHLSRLVPRIGKACACALWPVDWAFCYVTRRHVELGFAAGYGQCHVGYSVSYPGTPWLDVALAYSTAQELYDDIANFLATELSVEGPRIVAGAGSAEPSSQTVGGLAGGAPAMSFEHIVTKISSDGVFHGNSSLS